MPMNALDTSAAPRTAIHRQADFSLSDYRALIADLQGLGYRDTPLEGLVPDRRLVFLRHDVDLCIARALRVAEEEANLGVSASYYVLVSTEMYNPASAQSRDQLRRLRDLGHRIGLHFDATFYHNERTALETAADEECAILERLSGGPVDSISFHRPAPELMGLAGEFAGRRHTYEPNVFTEVAYISDSSGGFFQGHPLDHPSVTAGRALQLLTHPIWWADDLATPSRLALDRMRGERTDALDRVLAAATAKAKTRSAKAG